VCTLLPLAWSSRLDVFYMYHAAAVRLCFGVN
jgi:hypothetical protein